MKFGTQILVTGGCGSIGSAIVRGLLSETSVEAIRVFDYDEQALFDMQRKLKTHSDRLEFILGDIRDQKRIEQAVQDVKSVVHAAALKHVPLGESNPYESIQTNVFGTHQIIDAVRRANVDQVMNISTDKAAQPTSVMGATKMLSERLFVSANEQSSRTDFANVRLGNVVGTSGSVVKVFDEQIESGGPVTVTHPNMSRFIIPASEATAFIIGSLGRMSGGEIFIPKMDALKITDLADVMIEQSAPVGVDPTEIDIEIIGVRPGERLHERLLAEQEVRNAVEFDESLVLTQQTESKTRFISDGGTEITTPYRSDQVTHLSPHEITELLDRD